METLVAAQASLGQRPGGGPLTMSGGRKGIWGNSRPGGSARSSTAPFCRAIHSIPEAPAISKNKPLIVGYNRDETIFFFCSGNTAVFNLNEEALKERLAKELGANGGDGARTYRKARPEASPTDLYIAISART